MYITGLINTAHFADEKIQQCVAIHTYILGQWCVYLSYTILYVLYITYIYTYVTVAFYPNHS